MSVSIIAEFGSNPVDYDWNTLDFSYYASQSGATHSKIQLFKADHFPESERADKARSEYPRELVTEFAVCSKKYGLTPGASVFDAEAVLIAAKELEFIKLAAREQDNEALIRAVYRDAYDLLPVYRSVSDLKDHTLVTFHFKWTHLFALQEYPAPMAKTIYCLWMASLFFKKYKIPWGHSSHTTGWLDCAIAARLGASVIEKHLCLSKGDVEGGHSLLPLEFGKMVEEVRRWE